MGKFVIMFLPTLLLACGQGAPSSSTPEISDQKDTRSPKPSEIVNDVEMASMPPYVDIYDGGEIVGSKIYRVYAPIDDIVKFQVSSLKSKGFRVDDEVRRGDNSAEIVAWTDEVYIKVFLVEGGDGLVTVEFLFG